jgi:hypothetical protein
MVTTIIDWDGKQNVVVITDGTQTIRVPLDAFIELPATCTPVVADSERAAYIARLFHFSEWTCIKKKGPGGRQLPKSQNSPHLGVPASDPRRRENKSGDVHLHIHRHQDPMEK